MHGFTVQTSLRTTSNMRGLIQICLWLEMTHSALGEWSRSKPFTIEHNKQMKSLQVDWSYS